MGNCKAACKCDCDGTCADPFKDIVTDMRYRLMEVESIIMRYLADHLKFTAQTMCRCDLCQDAMITLNRVRDDLKTITKVLD